MNRSFVREKEQGGLEGLLLSPISRDIIFFGKAASNFIFMMLVELVLLLAMAVMLGFVAISWVLILTIFLTTIGFATLGTLFSAIAVETRSREVMLPVLFFPLIIPILIGSVEVTSQVIGGTSGAISRWLPLIVIFDALFLVICPWLFSAIIQE
jgi:heme exporter protein B